MKIKHIWSVLCRESVINQDDNVISLNNIMEEIAVTVTPKDTKVRELTETLVIPVNFEVTSFWYKEQKNLSFNAEIEYVLMTPKKEELLKSQQLLEFKPNLNRYRSRMKFSGLPIKMPGVYWLQVNIKEEDNKAFVTVSEIPFEVQIDFQKPVAQG